MVKCKLIFMIYFVFEEQRNGNKKFALFLFHFFTFFIIIIMC